jgi:hypothetical protein
MQVGLVAGVMEDPRHLHSSVACRPDKRHGQRRLNGIGRKQRVLISHGSFVQQLQPERVDGLRSRSRAVGRSARIRSRRETRNELQHHERE